jgi:hypothetical protein
MDRTKLGNSDADALLRAFYREEFKDDCAASRALPPPACISGKTAAPAQAAIARRKARRVELLAACALIALSLSPALFDAAQAPLAGRAAEALRQNAFRPLLTGLSEGAERVIRSYSESYPSFSVRAP